MKVLSESYRSTVVIGALAVVALGTVAGVLPAATGVEAGAVQEAWYVVEMLGQRAGYFHTGTRPTRFGERAAYRTLDELHTEIRRATGGTTETLVTVIRREWIEDAQHRTLRVEVVSDRAGSGQVQTVAEVDGEVAHLRTTRGGLERRWQQAWDENVLSPLAIEASFRDLLASQRQELTYRSFNPEVSTEVSTQRVRVVERFEGGGGVVEDEMVGRGIKARLVLDAEGRPVRHVVGPVSLRRATREEALEPLGKELGAFRGWTVTLDRPLLGARQLREAAFELVPREPGETLSLRELFLEDRRQTIEESGGVQILRVRVPERQSAPALDPDPDPADGYLAPSELIESDAPEIRELAWEATAGARDAREAANKLEGWVHYRVRYRGSGIGFASAVETLRSRDGDCTENAFLLTALLRARGIPARLVGGLVYTHPPDQEPGFAYHVWVEAHLGSWTALDSAIYGEVVDATHLAMAKTTGREEGAILELSASIFKSMGRFDLKLVEPSAPTP